MKRVAEPAVPPIPPELAGRIDAAQTIITYLLAQRTGANPDRVIAFAQWEKKARAELAELQSQAKLAIERDRPEAAAAVAASAGGGR